MDGFAAGWIDKWIFNICKTVCTVLPSSNERIRITSLDLAVKSKPTGMESIDFIETAKIFEAYIRKGGD
jgi:hypothetical protein